MTKNQFDKIFIPTPDVLIPGGLEGILKLADKSKKNLVVLSEDFLYNYSQFIDLHPWETDNVGAFYNALRETGVQIQKDEQKDTSLQQGVSIRVVPKEGKVHLPLVEIVSKTYNTLKETKESKDVIVLTSRPEVMAQLSMRGIKVEERRYNKIDPHYVTRYIVEISDPQEAPLISKELHNKQGIPISRMQELAQLEDTDLVINQYVLVPDTTYDGKYMAFRNNGNQFVARNIYPHKGFPVEKLWNPANNNKPGRYHVAQRVFFDLFFDPSIAMIVLSGGAGTGKTMAAYACMMSRVLRGHGNEKSHLNTLNLLKSIQEVEKDEAMGFLPGSKEDKLSVYYRHFEVLHESLKTNFRYGDLLFSQKEREEEMKPINGIALPNDTPPIRFMNINIIRGLTVVGEGLLVDEVQNISPKNMISVNTRLGEGSIFVHCGDHAGQFDNKKYDAQYNSILAMAAHFANDPTFACVPLSTTHRHPLAKLAESMPYY